MRASRVREYGVDSSVFRIALVAKPWRGGLGKYLRMTLEDMYPGRVDYVPTYPDSMQDVIAYRRDRAGWRSRLVERISKLQADVVLFVNLLPEFGGLVCDCPCVAWITDDPRPVLGYMGSFDRVFLSDPGYAHYVRESIGERYAGELPFACYPAVHVMQPAAPGAHGMCFVANRDAKRDMYLRALFGDGRKISVYGNYFMRSPLFWKRPWWFRPSVSNEALGDVYSQYHASLNIHAEVVLEGTNMRTFECAAYGIPQLVEFRPGLEALFDRNEELCVFEERDFLDMYDFMVSDRVEVCRRAANARDRVLSEHTYRHRVTYVLNSL